MKNTTYREVCELITAAEGAVVVFDGLTAAAWASLNANGRRERLQKAIKQMRETLRADALLDQRLIEMVEHHGGYIPRDAKVNP